jgi:hypothetical protein
VSPLTSPKPTFNDPTDDPLTQGLAAGKSSGSVLVV